MIRVQTKKFRVHLRHIGNGTPRRLGYRQKNFRTDVPYFQNIYLGKRYFIAIRPVSPGRTTYPGFFNVSMGRAMLAYRREEEACPWPGTDHYFGLCACPKKSQTHPSHITHETRMRDHILNDHGATLHPPGYGDGKAIGGTDEDAHLLHSIYFPNCQENP